MIEKNGLSQHCPMLTSADHPLSVAGSGRQTGQYGSPWSRGQTWLQLVKQSHSFGGKPQRSHNPLLFCSMPISLTRTQPHRKICNGS